MPTTARVAITGMGVFSPIGCHPEAIVAALREGRSGILPASRFFTEHLNSKFAGEVMNPPRSGGLTPHEWLRLDRTEQLALAAVSQAWADASLSSKLLDLTQVGLCVGASGAGLSHVSAEDVFSFRSQPHEQASAVASALGILGPVVMFTSASAGSGLALAHAMTLLRSGRCKVVLAGGAECLSQVNHDSMDGMGLCSSGPCSPFSGKPGLTVGEGSAFFVLERLDDAISRGARVLAELFSFGVTQDAYDAVGGDPSGQGLSRAFSAALNSAALEPDAVDWIKANGTSNRDQDAAETLAIRHVFQSPPPVTALESFIGHANGAAPAIGLGLALIAFGNSLLPPTLNFLEARAGCNLDYVPNHARVQRASCVLASSVGFGGSNVALLFGEPRFASQSAAAADSSLCITGVGVVSPFGLGFSRFIDGLQAGECGIRPVEDWHGTVFAGLIETLRTARVSRKHTLLQRFASVAADEAFHSASLLSESFDSPKFGVFVGLSRGSASARSRYAAVLSQPQSCKGIGKSVLRMGRFAVASMLSQRFRLKGYGATISDGFGAGLHALAHACVHLQNSLAEQALLVVAADETGPGPASSLAEMKWLAAGHDGAYLRAYDSRSKGTTLAEGAVALIVERTSFAKSRGARIRARIDGIGLTNGDQAWTNAICQAVENEHTPPVCGVYGNGSGIWALDRSELDGLRQVIPLQTPLGCVNSSLGFAESASGLFQIAAALHGLDTGEFFPLHDKPVIGDFRRILLTAKTEGHRNAAVVLGR